MIDPDVVTIFLARPDALSSRRRYASALAMLSPAERARIERLRFPHLRTVALASRVLQRIALSRCVDVAPDAWRFSEQGRPEITEPVLAPPLGWNASNTNGLVACAVTSDRAIGIDVEHLRPDPPYEIIEHHFTARERAHLCELSPADRARRFIELWTLKEAYVKARGLGLSIPLAGIDCRPTQSPPHIEIDPHHDDSTVWCVEQWWPTPQHCLSLCVARQRSPLPRSVRWEQL
jgi:4'-phosphopantetheinyl transferase